MKIEMKTKLLLPLLLITATSVQAQLYDNGGGLIYDSALNITWLQDANYAQTSGYSATGKMTWQDANTWANNLNYFDSANGVSYTGWTLPGALPANGTNYVTTYAADGSTDHGLNMTAGNTQLPYLFYVELGNQGNRLTDNTNNPAYTGIMNTTFQDAAHGNASDSFINVKAPKTLSEVSPQTFSDIYWTNQEESPGTAINFFTAVGFQSEAPESRLYYAWAVHPGNVGGSLSAVPVPAAAWLFGSGLLGLCGMKRRNSRNI